MHFCFSAQLLPSWSIVVHELHLQMPLSLQLLLPIAMEIAGTVQLMWVTAGVKVYLCCCERKSKHRGV